MQLLYKLLSTKSNNMENRRWLLQLATAWNDWNTNLFWLPWHSCLETSQSCHLTFLPTSHLPATVSQWSHRLWRSITTNQMKQSVAIELIKDNGCCLKAPRLHFRHEYREPSTENLIFSWVIMQFEFHSRALTKHSNKKLASSAVISDSFNIIITEARINNDNETIET